VKSLDALVEKILKRSISVRKDVQGDRLRLWLDCMFTRNMVRTSFDSFLQSTTSRLSWPFRVCSPRLLVNCQQQASHDNFVDLRDFGSQVELRWCEV
jgi:hypothetical protein